MLMKKLKNKGVWFNLFLAGCLITLFLSSFSNLGKLNPKQEILLTLKTQQKHWNEGNLEGFMSAYLNSDTLRFISRKGINYGHNKVLENYKKSYPDKAAMGNLEFDIIHLDIIGKEDALVTGKWTLKYPDKKENGGHFTLWMKKIKSNWFIVSDHTS